MNYRQRCYESYVNAHWKYRHSLSRKEYAFFARIAARRFRKFLPKNTAAKILDVACGAGHFVYFLQQQGYTGAQGIDLSAEQLVVAEKAGVKNLSRADLFEYLPRHQKSFDLVVANDIIEHLTKEEVLRFLDFIYRALLSGGHVLIGTPNAQTLLGAAVRYCDFTQEQGFTPGSLSQVLRVCGFEEVAVYGEKPVMHDVKSAVRGFLWWWVTLFLRFYSAISRGTGRGLWKQDYIFEPRIFALGRK